MEHWESLCPGGLRFVYEDDLFRPGTDSFLLSAFPALKGGQRVVDLGCGTGLLGLLLLQRQRNLTVTGIELQPRPAALARRCAAENGLEGQFTILEGDLRAVRQMLPTGSADLVVANPPYYEPHRGKLPERAALRTARSEEQCTLEDLCAAAKYLLGWGGRFCLVHKPERLTDVLCTLRSCAIEPKRLRFIVPRAGTAPSLFLLEGRRGGGAGLTILPPLIFDSPSGQAELDTIYFRKEATP